MLWHAVLCLVTFMLCCAVLCLMNPWSNAEHRVTPLVFVYTFFKLCFSKLLLSLQSRLPCACSITFHLLMHVMDMSLCCKQLVIMQSGADSAVDHFVCIAVSF